MYVYKLPTNAIRLTKHKIGRDGLDTLWICGFIFALVSMEKKLCIDFLFPF